MSPKRKTPGSGQADEGSIEQNVSPDCRADFTALQAQLLKHGHHLHVSSDGFMVERWGMCRYCATLAEVESFLKQIGGAA